MLGFEHQGKIFYPDLSGMGRTTQQWQSRQAFCLFAAQQFIGENINVFGSLEVDMFQNVRDTIQHKLQLTGAYFSVRYRPFRSFNITASYDNRRNVIFMKVNALT